MVCEAILRCARGRKNISSKSGYFARSAKPNNRDLQLIQKSAEIAVECAVAQKNGVVGKDIDDNNEIGLIEFARLKGANLFDPNTDWFCSLLNEIGQK